MQRKCPGCGSTFDADEKAPHRPFCSARCKKIDLANWLEGNYALPRALTPEEWAGLSADEQEAVALSVFGDASSALH